MKLHLFNLLLLIISICFFQTTHQYRLSKRIITEFDLTDFIVNTCSADKVEAIIQSLCDQTLESTLSGNFPVLISHCQTFGAKMRFCNIINQYAVDDQNTDAKQSAFRRRVRSLNDPSKLSHRRHKMDLKTNFELKLIMQICMRKIEKHDSDAFEFCNRTVQERYTDIERFCEDHPDFNYCRLVWSPSSFYFWSLSSSHSLPSKLSPSIVSSSDYKTVDVNPNNDQQRFNNKQEELSPTSSSS